MLNRPTKVLSLSSPLLLDSSSSHCAGANDGWTPLHEAAKNGKSETCKVIMFLNIEKNPRCRYGTVLHTAAWYGHLDVYKLISKYVKNKNPASGVDGATPLHFAAQQGQLHMCRYLIEKAWVDISFGN